MTRKASRGGHRELRNTRTTMMSKRMAQKRRMRRVRLEREEVGDSRAAATEMRMRRVMMRMKRDMA